MGTLVQKDNKNRLPAGSESKGKYFLREVDDCGRIIFTPQVLVPQNEYEDKIITLNDRQRDIFIQNLLNPPARNTSFQKGKSEFKKKYK